MRLWVSAAAIASLAAAEASAVSSDEPARDSAVTTRRLASSTVAFSALAQGACLGLPRNALLASCPAPCVDDAPCIVYDQNAEHSELTGCDYDTADSRSFCWSEPPPTCDIHCFAKYWTEGTFQFKINTKAATLPSPRPRTAEDPSLLVPADDAYQSTDFVFSIGKLNLSETMTDVDITGFAPGIDDVVDVAVDTGLLSHAPSVTTLRLLNVPLGNDVAAAIMKSASPDMKEISLGNANLTALSWEMFASMPNLKELSLFYDRISSISGRNITMPSLTNLRLYSNVLTEFGVQAPQLTTLDLRNNTLVRIPESVFTYSRLSALTLSFNPLIRPLVLTAEQVKFIEALRFVPLQLVDPPDDEMVSRLPNGGGGIYGNYFDDLDLSVLLKGTNETVLRRNPLLNVRVVDNETAAIYNDVLERRARARRIPSVPPADDTGDRYVPEEICQGVPRNTLLSNCIDNYCPLNGACVAYDQLDDLSLPSGCDYDMGSSASACASTWLDTTCEIQCFGAYRPQTQFKFFIPVQTKLGQAIKRNVINPDLVDLKTKEVPFLANFFVNTVGPLQLTSTITDVMIAGGRTEKVSRGAVADVIVSSKLLRKSPSVTSLSLLNIDLSKSDLAAVIASSPAGLKALDLRNTMLTSLPEGLVASMEQLEVLVLAQNDIRSLDLKMTTLPKLKSLDLSDNALTTIEIDAPNLLTLDMSANNLVRIPLSVFSLTRLVTLNLEANLFTFPLVVSPSQQAFLASLPDLRLTLPSTDGSHSPDSEDRGAPDTGEGGGGVPVGPTSGPIIPDTSGSKGKSTSLLPIGGTATVVNGIPVIIVSEGIANEYNDQLEQKQRESPPAPRTRATGEDRDDNDGDEVLQSAAESARATASSPLSSSTGTSSTSGSRQGSVSDNTDTRRPNEMTGSNPDFTRDKDMAPASKPDVDATTAASGESLVANLTLGCVAFALFAVMGALLFIFHKRRSRPTSKALSYVAMSDTADFSSLAYSIAKGENTLQWWEDEVLLSNRLNPEDIKDVRVIGSGGSGVVWLVNYRGDTRKLTSKRLIPGTGPAFQAKQSELYAEAKIASSLRYPKVVRFVGVAWTDETDFQVLYKYMANGDLASYLGRTDSSTLPWLPNKLQLAIDIIEALVYTHSFNPPLLHRDLKASNVLLDEDFTAKLGDFGCARSESDNNTMTASGVGTGRWLAPEILLGDTSYGTSSDIYSFGVVLCELDTHQIPYAKEAEGVSESTLLQRVARGQLRPAMSESCPSEIREMAEACLAFDPELRPTAMQVSHKLRALYRQHQRN